MSDVVTLDGDNVIVNIENDNNISVVQIVENIGSSGGGGGSSSWGAITGTLSNQTDLQTALNLKADISSIPDQLSDLSDDSTHRLVTDTEKTTWNNKLDGINLSTQTIDFLDEQSQVELIIVDATVTANTIINVRHSSEDLALQGVNFYVVKNIGVGYSIFGVAPNGASGQYQIQIEKVEGE